MAIFASVIILLDMEKGEKIKVYFRMNGRCYGLFNVIQMGESGNVDLKITDYYNGLIIASKTNGNDKGYLTEQEMEDSRFIQNAEISYHKDGSILHKVKDGCQAEYFNPYGTGERWTSTNSIEDFQPIMLIAIRRMSIYNKSCFTPKQKSKELVYICENDDLFEPTGTYLVVLYMCNKNIAINCYTSAQLYSDVLVELNEQLNLCLFIQRHSYPKPQPYYSEYFKCTITPYLDNSIIFCNRDTSKDEIRDKFDKAIFDPIFHKFLSIMTDGQFVNLTEDKLKVIDQVDLLYKGHEGEMAVSKPFFIKLLLNYLGDNVEIFNKLPLLIKQELLKLWNCELEQKISKK